MSNFVLTFRLKTEKWQQDILDKRLEIGRQIYNALLNLTQKRYKEMKKTKKYRNLIASLTGDKKQDRETWKKVDELRKEYHISEYDFMADVKLMQHHFKENVDAFTAQNNYNENGTVKRGAKKWIRSKRYLKWQDELRKLYAKQSNIRKYQHECLANEIISLGDNIFVEKMSFQGLQRKAKNTVKNEKGKYKCKKRFGRSIANRAPAELISIIDRKLHYYDKRIIEIDTWKARASQFNHFDQIYKKKKLSQRWNDFNGVKVQRDMYSAFLIMNAANDLQSFDLEKCNERFDNFYRLHNLEVERLKGRNNLSSIAI